MSVMDRLFLQHPRDQHESYLQHARFAAGVGTSMVWGGLACMVHALVPGLCTTSGSRTLRELNVRIASRGGPAR